MIWQIYWWFTLLFYVFGFGCGIARDKTGSACTYRLVGAVLITPLFILARKALP